MASNKALFVFVLVGCFLISSEAFTQIGNPVNAPVTYYNEASGAGACSYTSDLFNQNALLVAAAANFNVNGVNAWACGQCVQIVSSASGVQKSIVVKVVDQCPGGCGGKAFDLSPYAFSQLANPSLGQINACYNLVSCDTDANIQYWLKEGSSQWWFQILVWNHKVPLQKLEVQQSGSSTWVSLPKQEWNYYDGSALGEIALPLKVRVTATNGEVITDTLSNFPGSSSVVKIQSSKQFTTAGYTVTGSCGAVSATKTRSRSRSKKAASKTRSRSKSRSRKAASKSRTRSRTKSRTRSRTRTRTRSRTPSKKV